SSRLILDASSRKGGEQMLKNTTIVGLLLLGGATARATNEPEKSVSAEKKESGVDQQADAVLRRMSTYLGSLKTVRVDTTTIDEKVTTNGLKVQEIKESRVAMARPNKI